MSHTEEIKVLLMTKPFVLISELRIKFNYRSRIADLRKQGFNIKPIRVDVDNSDKKAHAYMLVRTDIIKKEGEKWIE